ncbi:MAG: coproporphyrinogen III oxidase [Peptococcaceae bacterium BRH_c4b]|nr:MAG: coproporphyrinogen III oxidase [Peptococcaceae bacterium BRH_c4b]
MTLSFEQGPIRPPSEAYSLLLRLTRNCPWNKCAFCRTYKGKSFSRRSVEEVKEDIDRVVEVSRLVGEVSQRQGYGGEVNGEVLAKIYESGQSQFYHVAFWLYHGGRTAFLQDANSLIMKTEDLLEIINYLKKRLPTVERITSYARSITLLRKEIGELAELGRAGLSRIHVGLESGSDEVLKFIDKGVTSLQHIDAGRRVKEAGISLSEYVILGMGGQRWAREHPLDTARVLNAINPDFIRLRSLTVVKGTPLHEKMVQGEFIEQSEEDVVRGEKLLIESLRDIQSSIVSDHSLNLLEEVKGKLPVDKSGMLAVIDRFLELTGRDKENFILGKRWGMYRVLDDMADSSRHARVQEAVDRLSRQGSFLDTISSLKNQII